MKRRKKRSRKKVSGSHVIAIWMLAMTSVVSIWTLHLMGQCISYGFTGELLPLTALISLMQAGNGIVLTAYFRKSKAENTTGGIVYESAMRDL